MLLPLPLGGTYDYLTPDGCSLRPGDIVEVPLGPRRVVGVVWDEGSGDAVDPAKLRRIGRRFDAPPLAAGLRRFVEWVADYTLAPRGPVLRMVLSSAAALEPAAPVRGVRIASRPAEAGLRQTDARRRVLALLADGPARALGETAREAGVGPGVVHGLIRAGALETVDLPPAMARREIDWRRAGPILSPAQVQAAARLRDGVAGAAFSVTLLEGVTGSGKTETYLEAVAAALAAGRQALILVPEIALTLQLLDRFRGRFGVAPAEWHSDLTAAQRRDTWRAVAEGRAPVVVAARSGLFLPFAGLGLIVVDEEHDPAFKQEDGVAYQARDMAVVRGRIEDIPVILVSATPSIETVVNVRRGRYAALHLPERHAGASLPAIAIVDLRREPPPRGRWLSPPLVAAVRETLDRREQALLFLNRRGYAPLTLCRSCGHRLQCPHCTAWLVEHRLFGRLQCHHCGFSAVRPSTCPACGAADSFVACGPGVERIAEEAGTLFPQARIAIVASDLFTGPRAAAALLERVAAHEIDLLVGTQVLAKGHHFPLLTAVGVVDADLGLAGGDLRAAERTFQLLAQVSGRAGRAERPGRVFLQSYAPDTPLLAALARHDRRLFLDTEIEARRRSGMPPFGRLAALIVSASDPAAAEAAARAIGRAAPHGAELRVLGPAPAPLAVLRGRYRWRLLLRTARRISIQAVLRAWLGRVRVAGDVRLQVDVDPYSFV